MVVKGVKNVRSAQKLVSCKLDFNASKLKNETPDFYLDAYGIVKMKHQTFIWMHME